MHMFIQVNISKISYVDYSYQFHEIVIHAPG